MPPDETKPTKPKTRERKFPIRQFSNLLDEFLSATGIDVTSETVANLRAAVDQALLAHYKS